MYAERLKELRVKKGHSQIQVAELVGVSGPSYAAYESGKSKPSIDTLVTLSKHYGVSLDWLCGIAHDQANEIKTYGEIAKMIYNLLLTGKLSIYNANIGTSDSYPGRSAISMYTLGPQRLNGETNEVIECFLGDTLKMWSLIESKTITQSIFNEWLNSRLIELNAIPLSTVADSES